MGAIQDLAIDLDAEERTLRRAAAIGTIRTRRPGPRRIRLPHGETEYLRNHWQLLAELRRTLRVERGVRLTVLYGSLARGDEDADSDVDLAISLAHDHPLATLELAVRLEGVIGRRIDIPRIEHVEATAPLLLERILEEGRPIVDRDGLWWPLRQRRRAIRARADRAYRKQMDGAKLAIEELTA